MAYDNEYKVVKPPKGMTAEDVVAVQSALSEAADYIDTEISPNRVKATEYYYGEPFGDEQEGRSRVVSQDVRDTVHAILPSLIRVFTGADKVVEFVPQAGEDTAMAEQATDYANFVMMRDNPGFTTLYSIFKDALIRQTGATKTYWDDSKEVTYEYYEELDDGAVEALELDEELEITEKESYPDEAVIQEIMMEYEFAFEQYQMQLMEYEQTLMQVPEGEDPTMYGLEPPIEPQMPPEEELPQLHDLTVKRTQRKGRIAVEALPPEELIISKGARSFANCWKEGHVIGHRTEKTISQLVAMGYDEDQILDYVGTSELSTNEERLIRHPSGSFADDGYSGDDENRRVLYVEAWMAKDLDDDGIAELRKFCCLGDGYQIISQEPASYVPIADFCPDPEPHTAIGRSVADVLMDIQRIKSGIVRGMLDSLAQSINPRTGVVEGQVNMNDVLNNEVGGIIRMRQPGMVQPFATPFVGQQAFPMLEYMDRIKEKRTGITDATQGLNAEVLQSTTKAAVSATIEAAQQHIELIARIFAETGMKALYKHILKVATQYQDKTRVVRLRKEEYVEMDPRTWNSDMDVEINTAISAASQEDRLAALSVIVQKQEQILQTLGPNNPLVTLGQYSHSLAKLVEAAGFKDTVMYFNQVPIDFQMPEPEPGAEQPSPEMLLAEVQREEIQANIEKKRAELQLDQEKAQQDFALRREDMLRRDDRERDRMEKELALRAAQINSTQVNQAQVRNDMARDRRVEEGDQFIGQ